MSKRTFLLFFSFMLVAVGLLVFSRPLSVAARPLGSPLDQPRANVPQQQPTPSDNDVNRVAKQLFCPVCENIPLDVCPTQACHDWRELIRQKLAQGWTDQQIREYFAQQYGDRVLAEPPRRGLNWLVYALPPIAIVIGGVIVWQVLSSMRKRTAPIAPAPDGSTPAPGSPTGPTPSKTADDPYLARLEEELKNKD
jgi:cytochrome c-type biogenesis protein CcmH